ncbi:MAG: hypothetical protein MNPFHGCM_01858 [Gemmatimonadaceae bacterium]|nr:hypothetical protein [Gemmatimonadaceae bacterium]
MLAIAAPGTTRASVDHAAGQHGMRFPIDPSSGAFCSVGGMVATNASGARSLKFGSTRRWVTGLECIFADGSRTWVRRGADLDCRNEALARFADNSARFQERAAEQPTPAVRKNSSGLGLSAFARSGELIDLLCGSEGTLCAFSGVELALAEVPESTASLLASWSSLDDAVRGAALAREAGASACELLDRTFVRIVAEHGDRALPVDVNADTVLLIEMESPAPASGTTHGHDESARRSLEAGVAALKRALYAAGASQVLVGLDPESEESLWAIRHAASPILARLDPAIASMQVIEDGAVPPSHLAEYVRGVRGALVSAGFRGVIFGHAGDANVHVNVLVDVREPAWRERLARLFGDVTELTARLGGTPTGEHGDGRLRTPVLERFWSAAALDLIRDIKATLDPRGILNPGVKTPAPADFDVWHAIKYDPGLATVPAKARLVLDRVERERAYDRSRLEMLAAAL